MSSTNIIIYSSTSTMITPFKQSIITGLHCKHTAIVESPKAFESVLETVNKVTYKVVTIIKSYTVTPASLNSPQILSRFTGYLFVASAVTRKIRWIVF